MLDLLGRSNEYNSYYLTKNTWNKVLIKWVIGLLGRASNIW